MGQGCDIKRVNDRPGVGWMDVFELRGRLVEDYARYTRNFIETSDLRVGAVVQNTLTAQ